MLTRKSLTSLGIMICFLFLSFILVEFIFSRAAHAEIFMSISGAVKDASTGKGISGVDVMAAGIANKQSFFATTDANGSYSIKIVPEGQYNLQILNPPAAYVMQPYMETVKVEQGKNIVAADFALPLGGSVSGIIYKSAQSGVSPLTNAPIFVLSNNGVSISSTDANGRYLFTGLRPEVSTKLRIFSYGFGMVSIDNVMITAGQNTANINMTFLAAATGIKGIVSSYDSVGLPIANAYVILIGNNGFGFTTTDANGNYAIQGLPAGQYQALTIKIGFQRVQTNNIAIIDGQTINQNFTLVSQPLPVISGSNETDLKTALILNFKIDNKDYPYAGLQFKTMGSGACICIGAGVSTVVGGGLIITQTRCICAQQCGSTTCTSHWRDISICDCIGVDVGLSGQVQYCNSIPRSGNNFQANLGTPIGGFSAGGTSLGDACYAYSQGVGPLGFKWALSICSCTDQVDQTD